jgi:sugar/nucleoside kinase (ribokinase family)
MLVCALGDLLLDVVVTLESPIQADTDTFGAAHVCPGGQAANVARWVAALGGRSRVVTCRAADLAGRLLAERLAADGVELVGPVVAAGTGTVVSIATPDGRRTMLTDRGISARLASEDLDPAWLAGCDWLHVSGYALMGEPQRSAALKATAHARANGSGVSLDLASVRLFDGSGGVDVAHACSALAPDLVFATESERAAAGSLCATTWIVKRGRDGVVVERSGDRVEHPAPRADVVDATGAGDALAAGFLVSGVELALSAAARCIGRPGAGP